MHEAFKAFFEILKQGKAGKHTLEISEIPDRQTPPRRGLHVRVYADHTISYKTFKELVAEAKNIPGVQYRGSSSITSGASVKEPTFNFCVESNSEENRLKKRGEIREAFVAAHGRNKTREEIDEESRKHVLRA